ncbi:uncharacterized protein B0H18DRAFT_1125333 [Fomitopsis serialis]|uniref:uncharacterized protein n=1 Tax=Fomitopsis serialis TaxID=139415 RepID=UPI002008023F|nr:uncharacterized protein B0H18DRAFT_1125333 [Neoantrodia serialis]KAH9914749.1 hypothetical protein B0H18DRAFT_1125333 [Neoantrodia serialis]
MPGWMTSAKAPIAAVTLECIIYGFATCTFAMTVWVLKDRRKLPVNTTMLIIAAVLWLMSTVRTCTDIVQLETAFDNDNLRTPTGPFDYLLDFSHGLFVFDQCLYYISTIIGDAVVIFRCYAVWKKWYIIAFPCLTCVGAICSFAWVEWCFAKGIPYLNWILMAFAFTLATNLIATVLLAYRIWAVGSQTYRNFDSTYRRNPLRPILFVIIESGMIYSVMLMLALITIIHAPSVEWVVNGLMTSLISLIFNMVFVSIGMTKNLQGSTAVRSSIRTPVPLGAVMYNNSNHDSRSGSRTEGTTDTGPSVYKGTELKHVDSYV